MKKRSFHALRNRFRYRFERYFGVTPDILWIASYPRSGNTFYRMVLKQLYGSPSFDSYRLRKPSQGVDVGEHLGITRGKTARDAATGNRIQIVKTHSLRNDESAAVYIVRDGRDAVVSHAHFQMQYSFKLPPEEQTYERFVEALKFVLDPHNFRGWSTNVNAWTSRSARTAVIKFEDLIRTPLDVVRTSMAEVNYILPELETTTLPTFEDLHEQTPEFFRKGRVGGWREEMPDDLHKLFWERHGEIMIKMGYTDGMP